MTILTGSELPLMFISFVSFSNVVASSTSLYAFEISLDFFSLLPLPSNSLSMTVCRVSLPELSGKSSISFSSFRSSFSLTLCATAALLLAATAVFCCMISVVLLYASARCLFHCSRLAFLNNVSTGTPYFSASFLWLIPPPIYSARISFQSTFLPMAVQLLSDDFAFVIL